MLLKQTDSTATRMAEDEYDFLKTDVVKSVLSSPQTPENYMDILLQRYQYSINSARDLSQVRKNRNIVEFLAVLERRDCLSHTDVSVLVDIAHLWNCEYALASINRYKIRFNLLGMRCAVCAECGVCGKDEKPEQQQEPPRTCLAPIPQPRPEVHERNARDQGLDEAIERISRRLGRSWKNLARTKEFGFKEYDIDALEDDYKFMADQISHMFQEWRQREGKKATLPRLMNGLLRARRRDLADLLDDADD